MSEQEGPDTIYSKTINFTKEEAEVQKVERLAQSFVAFGAQDYIHFLEPPQQSTKNWMA